MVNRNPGSAQIYLVLHTAEVAPLQEALGEPIAVDQGNEVLWQSAVRVTRPQAIAIGRLAGVRAVQPPLVPLVTRYDFSPGEIYDLCKEIDGQPHREGTFSLAGARVVNFLDQRRRQHFYEPAGTYDQLLEIARLNHQLREAGVPEWALATMLVSFRMFESAGEAPGGRLPLPVPGEPERGGHSVALTGGWDDDGEALQFVNSWGVGWGDRGHGWLSREYLDRYMVDTWLARDVRVGPSLLTSARLNGAVDMRAYAQSWMMPNPRWRVRRRHRGHGHQLVLYETVSAIDHCGVEIIEVRNGFGIRLGWAHLFHLGGGQRGTSMLKELFVWPLFRRRGYGSLLERIAVDRARHWRSERLHLLFHEMDALPSVRAAGRLFGQQAGYTWRWRRGYRPNVEAIGEKVL